MAFESSEKEIETGGKNAGTQAALAMSITDAPEALLTLERMVSAVKGHEAQESKFAKALATLQGLSRKEGIPLAIVSGLAAIHHGYERFTKDIDVVVASGNLENLTRLAPHYGIKVIWNDPEGWHKLQCEGVPIDVVRKIRNRLGKAHATYLRRFDKLLEAANEEKEQERERGGGI